MNKENISKQCKLASLLFFYFPQCCVLSILKHMYFAEYNIVLSISGIKKIKFSTQLLNSIFNTFQCEKATHMGHSMLYHSKATIIPNLHHKNILHNNHIVFVYELKGTWNSIPLLCI